jgi:phosphoribosylformylglycinamidine synthase
MKAVKEFAANGGPVLGICNGFQILLESGMLPGAMLHNEKLRFICKNVHIRVESTRSAFTAGLSNGDILEVPVSHGEGNYFIEDDGLKQLEDNDQVAFRYCNANGKITPESNVNGSVSAIAGIINTDGNVLGMMPHPERAMEPLLGSTDGVAFFESVFKELNVA